MKTIIKYISIAFLMTIFFVACDDIVTYDDNVVDETRSYGPPVITRISPVETPETDTTQGGFNQMVIIHGENLSKVTSIKFNDQSVDTEEIYATYSRIVVAIPGNIPDEITNKVVVTTEKGETEFPFKVTFPDFIINGFSCEFGNDGDEISIFGENLLLYDLTAEKGEIRVNGTSATIVSTTEREVKIILPTGTIDNSKITLSSPRILAVLGEEPIEVAYRDPGFRIVDIGPNYMTNPWTSGFATDGMQEGDPKPISPGTCFSRIKGTVGGYSTNITIYNYPFDAPISDPFFADMKANPQDYEIKYELLVKSDFPIIAPQDRISLQINSLRAMPVLEREWHPAKSGVAYHTNDKWVTQTFSVDLFKNATGGYPVLESGNTFTYAYVHAVGTVVPTDFSMANLRFNKKINLVRKQI